MEFTFLFEHLKEAIKEHEEMVEYFDERLKRGMNSPREEEDLLLRMGSHMHYVERLEKERDNLKELLKSLKEV